MDRHLAVREPLTTGVESQVSDAKDPEHGVPAARFSDLFQIVDATPLCATESLRQRSSRKFWRAFDLTSCGPDGAVLHRMQRTSR
jgi:hypothetical protein